jgi:hypothetical protein
MPVPPLTSRRGRRLGLTAILGAAAALASAGARAAPAESCVPAYERAQELRTEGKLRAARAQLLACAQPACQGFIRSDCGKWLDEVTAGIPTVVFAARRDGRDTDQVRVTAGGEVVAERLDGRAVAVDPGKHRFRFEASDGAAGEAEILAIEGQKRRVVQIDLRLPAAVVPPVAAPPAPIALPWHARRPLRFALAGVGALGLGGFAVLGWTGWRKEKDLSGTCAPACGSGPVQSVRTRYLLADISLGVGLAAAGAAVYLHFRHRAGPPERDAGALAWGAAFVPGGPLLTLAAPY